MCVLFEWSGLDKVENSNGTITKTLTEICNLLNRPNYQPTLTPLLSNPTDPNKKFDFCYFVSDCYSPFQNRPTNRLEWTISGGLEKYCFDLQSGSLMNNVKIQNANIRNTNTGESISFLTSTKNLSSGCTGSKLQPRTQVKYMEATSTYDVFSMKMSADGN